MTGSPLVSVVIPVRNEGRAIAGCLDAVLGQDYPARQLEVLVVDGGSHDDTTAVVERYRAKHGHLRLLQNPAGTIPAGLNVGIKAAQGDIVARVDCRTKIASDYVSTAVGLLADTGATTVGGPVRYAPGSYMAQVLALVMQSRFGVGGAAARYGDDVQQEWTDTVYLAITSRDTFARAGYYDEEILQDEDSDLSYRIRALGGRILLSPLLRSSYANSGSFGRFVSKNVRFGFSKARVWQKYPAMASWRHFVPPVFVLTVAGGAALTLVSAPAATFLAALSVLYGTASIASSVALSRRAGWHYLPVLPAAFTAMHFAWGAGFIAGAVRFLPRWAARRSTSRTPAQTTGVAA
jgi:glycosyltransferase involved in cell wall biosynthesis